MRIVITEWALDAYTEMVGRDFTEEEYWSVLRPDIERLHRYPVDPFFKHDKSWGPAQLAAGADIPAGFKMKWHNIGPGLIQLRLCVAIIKDEAWLCHAYSKTSPKQDFRKGLQLFDRIDTIRDGRAVVKGEIP